MTKSPAVNQYQPAHAPVYMYYINFMWKFLRFLPDFMNTHRNVILERNPTRMEADFGLSKGRKMENNATVYAN